MDIAGNAYGMGCSVVTLDIDVILSRFEIRPHTTCKNGLYQGSKVKTSVYGIDWENYACRAMGQWRWNSYIHRHDQVLVMKLHPVHKMIV